MPSSPSFAESALTTPGHPSVQTLGRYELLTPIGRGGMAVVWAARLRGTHGFSKIVAIKTMLPVLSKDPHFEAMFLAEAQIASGIKHPNVCEILDLGEDHGTVYLVMESIDGEPLSRLEDACIESRRRIACGIAARIVAQAARGLHAAHELKTESGEPSVVIHRDVSPQNILVTCAGIVKIVDFGVAKAAVRSTPTTAAGVIKGKIAYLAPEQIEARDIDHRIDIFALGIVLYELVAGVNPFHAATDLAMLLAIASPDPAPRLPGREDAYPPALHAIVARALAKDPAKRYASMRELAIALEELADDEAVTADAVAAFVTEVLGDERSERRRAMHEAARAADARGKLATPTGAASGEGGTGKAGRAGEAGNAGDGRASSLRNVVLAVVLVVGIAGITMGALGLRALSTKTRESEPVAAASPSTRELPPPQPRLAIATVASAPSSVTVTLASASPSSSSSPPPASVPAPLSATPRSPVVRAASSARVAAPAPSGSAAAKRGPLDGWD